MIYLASRAPDCVRHVASRARAAVSRGGGRGGRGVSRGRFARARGLRCVGSRRVVALAVLALVLLVPSVARAEVSWNEKDTNYAAVVAPYEYSANGRAAALAEYLGYDWNSLTQEAQNFIVSYKNRDNYFASALTKNVKNVMYETNGTLEWPIISVWSSLFGLDKMWDISMSSGQYNSAVAEFQESLDAWISSSGIGGGGSVQGEYYQFSGYCSWYSNTDSQKYVTGTDGDKYSQHPNSYYAFTTPIVCLVPKSALDFYFSSKSPDTFNTYIYVVYDGSSKLTTKIVSTNNTPTLQTNRYWDASEYISYLSYGASSSSNQMAPTYTYDGQTFVLDYSNGHYSVNSSSGGIGGYSNTFILSFDGEYNGEPNYPIQPTPPEIPAPDPPEHDPIQNPGIQLPSINFPDITMPDLDFSLTMPTGTDVVPYLKKIIANQEDIGAFLSDSMAVLDEDLDNIGSALGEHCNHIQQQIQHQVYWLATELQDMFDGLEVGISNYLYRVQTKLLQGIGWEFDNLSQDVISWLKRIYSRLGGNGISKPDINTDEKGFWDWLMEQFAKFLADLAGKPLDAVDELFDLLKDFFPFSLPWDFYTMLGLLAHEPVTPVFDLPMPVPSVVSSGHTQGIHIDCHAWDDTMFVVRSLEMLFFAFKVFHMVPRWFNFIKVAE